jgi:hypothetical protein
VGHKLLAHAPVGGHHQDHGRPLGSILAHLPNALVAVRSLLVRVSLVLTAGRPSADQTPCARGAVTIAAAVALTAFPAMWAEHNWRRRPRRLACAC